jgi:hypothetical protein
MCSSLEWKSGETDIEEVFWCRVELQFAVYWILKSISIRGQTKCQRTKFVKSTTPTSLSITILSYYIRQ